MCFSSIQPWSSTTAPCWNSRITTGMRIILRESAENSFESSLEQECRAYKTRRSFAIHRSFLYESKDWTKGNDLLKQPNDKKRLKRWYIFLRILDGILTVWYTEYAVCNVQLIWQLSRSTHRSYPKKGIFYGNLFRTRLSGVRSENKVSAAWKPIEVRLSHDLPL